MKLILDTDIGSDIDDALALLLLMHLRDVEILGVTTVYGCVDIRAQIARKIIAARGLDIPVIAGLPEPLGAIEPVWVTGREGRGILSEEEMSSPPDARCVAAEDFIIDMVEGHPDAVILAIGPLTNVAKAFRRHPGLDQKVRAIYFMGGGVLYPNRVQGDPPEGRKYKARASHNVCCDLEAARIVFNSEVRIAMVTNDATRDMWWHGDPVRALLNTDLPPESVLVGKLLQDWLEYRSGIFRKPISGTCPHDALTAAEAVGRSFVRYGDGVMTVLPHGSTRFEAASQGRHSAGIAADAAGFVEWFSPILLGDESDAK